MGLAVKKRNCCNLLNVLQNSEVVGGFGLFGGRKVACCEIKKVQCQSVCREVCPDNSCLDENTLRAKHPYVMLSSRIDFVSEKCVRTILVSMKTIFGQSIRM